MHAILGIKYNQTQRFLIDGTRIPVTGITVMPNTVVTIKNKARDGYVALQIGIGAKKHTTKPLQGHIKEAKLEKTPAFMKEIRIEDETDMASLPQIGDQIALDTVLKPGDIVSVTGVSKGKGFAGVVKRHHFRGGPRTHGQSDRERAPGSIGQTTTPGRVYKGKRMAGKMGNDTVTITNLEVVGVENTRLLIKGLVPGAVKTFLIVKKIGEKKKFVPLIEKEAEIKQA